MPAESTNQFQSLFRDLRPAGRRIRVLTHRRSLQYLAFLLVLLPLSLVAPYLPLRGGLALGVAAEALATNLALLAGLAALLHYFGTKTLLYAFVGSGYLGAALLDGFHAVTAWGLLAGVPALPASSAGSGARWFLPFWIWLGVWAIDSDRKLARLIQQTRAPIWLAAGGLTLLCLLWTRLSPQSIPAAGILGHVASSALFFGAIEALLHRRHWPHDTFEHCLMLSLIVGFLLNTLFLSGSREIYDPLFTAAAHLKGLSYALALGGLVIGLHELVRRSERHALALGEANQALHREIAEHNRVQQQYQELDRSLEQRIEDRTRELREAESAAVGAMEASESAGLRLHDTNQQLRAQIQERTRMEQALRESERRLQLALDAGQIGICTWDSETNHAVWDERVYHILGSAPGEFPPTYRGLLSRVHPDDVEEVDRAARRSVEQGVDLDIAYRVRRPDGSVRHVMTRAVVFRDSVSEGVRMIGTLYDVTEHKRGEEELRWSSEQLAEQMRALRCLYEVSELVAQSELPLERIYEGAIKLLPLSWREPESTHARLTVDEQVYCSAHWNAAEIQHATPVVANGMPAGRLEIGFANGSQKAAESLAAIIKVVDMAAASLGRAIEYKRATEQLRRSERRYHGLYDHMVDACALHEVIVDENGKPADCRFLEVNPAYERLAGLRAEDLLGKTLREALPAYDPKWLQTFAQVALSGEPIRGEYYSQGFQRHVEVAAFSPELGRFAVVFHDISGRKLVEEKLYENRRRMETLLSNLPGMAYRCRNDPDWSMEFISKGCEAITGWKPEELAARSYAELIDPEDRALVWDEVQNAIAEHRPFQVHYRIQAADGRTKWLWEQGTAIFSTSGEVEALEGFISDISEQRRAKEELERKAKELAASNADLEQFAYAASHDLQEPLRTVASYTQLLARRYKGKLDSDAEEFMGFTVDAVQRLQALIRDLLQYSRVGREAVIGEPVSLEECAAASLDNLRAALSESAAQIELTPLPVVAGHRSQLIQLFQNLIGNAVKYHGDAAPRVQVSAEKRGNEWLFAVRDNGIGIDPKYHGQVFDLLRRLHTRKEYSGTGIGLAVCKKIVENHGGRIWVESNAGQGSAFQFTLPAEPPTI